MVKYKEQRNDTNELEGYIRVADNASIPIARDNRDYQAVLAWIANGGTPSADNTVLDKVKQLKVNEYKNEGIRRIGVEVAEWNTFETVKFVASIWNMLGTPNVKQTKAKNIYMYMKNTAIPDVNALTMVQDVQAIDVANDTNWP